MCANNVSLTQRVENAYVKPENKSVTKGGLIGAGIGAAAGAGYSGWAISAIKKSLPKEDEFIKQTLESAKGVCTRNGGVVDDNFIATATASAKNAYKYAGEKIAKTVKEAKKAIPVNVLTGAAILAVVGGAIGWAVNHFKNKNVGNKTDA